jgi:dephospho-CoA kinase
VNQRFLLTGGIGSGKTTTAAIFESLGARVISADLIGHTVIAPQGEAFAAVAARFPEAVVGGSIDRSRLAATVFADQRELHALEEITHPAIREQIAEEVAGLDGVVLVEVPLITDFLGPGWGRIVVDAPVPVRLERLLARGMTREDAEARISVQPTRGEWLEVADLVVDNRGDLAALAGECAAVWSRITSL